ncbi:MAG: Uncharacterized protein C1O27_001058 [Chloroflexi bacterium]|jgi:photosystem II stability/assembly factor-like uncharacterized protein|nr:MAG: Uncharacterized protein C1O27_001058 [Chloroflexota bacterium]
MLVIGTEAGAYRISDSGEQLGSALDGMWFNEITPDGSGRLLASVRDNGVYVSTDDGETWRSVLDNVDAWTVAVSPTGTLYAGIQKGLYQSTSGGEEWEELTGLQDLPTFENWGFPLAPHVANVHSLAFSHKDSDTIYAGVEVGGVIASSDRGKTWRDLREGLHLDIHTLVSAPGNEDVLHAATGRGMFRSLDAGESWEAVNEGLESIYMIPAMIHPKDPQVLFTAASQGRPRYWRREEGADATMYRSKNGGDSWEPIMGGLTDRTHGLVMGFAADPDNDDTIYAGTSDGEVLVSRNLGDSWSTFTEGLPSIYCLTVV